LRYSILLLSCALLGRRPPDAVSAARLAGECADTRQPTTVPFGSSFRDFNGGASGVRASDETSQPVDWPASRCGDPAPSKLDSRRIPPKHIIIENHRGRTRLSWPSADAAKNTLHPHASELGTFVQQLRFRLRSRLPLWCIQPQPCLRGAC
jgi:hypothetical protein